MRLSLPKNSRIILAVAFALFASYLLTPSQNFTYADDSLPFAVSTWAGHRTIPHHLILGVLHSADQALGQTGPGDLPAALQTFRWYVALMSFMSLVLMGHLSLRWFDSLRVALMSMLAVAFTYGFWCYAIVTDVYVEALACVLLAVFLAERSYDARRPRATYSWLIAAAFATLAAAINHQSECLVVLSIGGVLLFARAAALPFVERLRRTLTYAGLTGALGLTTFYAAYVQSRPATDFITWIRGYTAWMELTPDDKPSLMTPVFTALGIARSIIYPELSMHFARAYEVVHSRFALKLLMDDRFLSHGMTDGTVIAVLILEAIVLLAVPVMLFAAVREGIRRPPSAPGFWMLLLWVPVQAPLFALWEPASNEMWIWMLPCLGLLGVGLAASSARHRVTRNLPWIVIAALLIANGTVVALYHDAGNCIYRTNKTYLQRVRPQDLAIAPYLYPSSDLTQLLPRQAPQFEPQEGAFEFRDPAFQSAYARVQAAHGSIYLDPVLVMPVDTEIHLLRYRANTERAHVEEELRKLEADCARTGTPLFGVVRKGEPMITFVRYQPSGWLKWVNR